MSTGVEGLDCLLGGGAPAGGSVLVEGACGTGKTILATQFIAEGGHQGQPGVVLLPEERPERFIARAESMDLQLGRLTHCGLVQVLSLRGRDMSADELIHVVQRAVLALGAQRVVLDSIGGIKLLLRDDGPVVRDCLWRLLDGLTGGGVTVWLNQSSSDGPRLRSLVDDVLELTRLDGALRLEVVKSSCGTSRSRAIAYEIGDRGIQLCSSDELGPSNGHVLSYRFAG